MSNFKSTEGDIKDIFITDAWLIDRYTGGELFSWGANYPFMGRAWHTDQVGPPGVPVLAPDNKWKDVVCGAYHAVGIKTDGTLWAGGDNGFFQCGVSLGVNCASSPVQTLVGGSTWKQISAGYGYTAGLKTDGTLWLWGVNDYGQLGNNSVNIYGESSAAQTVAGGTDWKQVSCGLSHTVAIKTDGTLWSWGSNDQGQLGDNSTTHRSSPVQIVAGGTDWKQVSGGNKNSGGIKIDGTLWMWGENSKGELGDNTRTKRSSPVQTVAGGTNWKSVNCHAAFYVHWTAGLKTDGTLWMWGDNAAGNLGDNTSTDKSSPVQTVAGGTNWKQYVGHPGAMKTDGTLWIWGSNGYGEITYDPIGGNYSSPVQILAGGRDWLRIGSGSLATIFAIAIR